MKCYVVLRPSENDPKKRPKKRPKMTPKKDRKTPKKKGARSRSKKEKKPLNQPNLAIRLCSGGGCETHGEAKPANLEGGAADLARPIE